MKYKPSSKAWTTAFVLVAALAASRAEAGCAKATVTRGVLQVEQEDIAGACTVSVLPVDGLIVVYRDYAFDSTGMLMVFNSVDGPEETSAGARSYVLFPRRSDPSYRFPSADILEVTDASGQVFRFSTKTGRIDSIPGVDYSEDPQVSMGNGGGVEIRKTPGVWLDTGWQVGSASYQHPQRTSLFHDASGASCEVTNSEIFANGKDQDPVFNFSTDKALADFLSRRCPKLDVSPLRTSALVSAGAAPRAGAFPVLLLRRQAASLK